MLKSRKICFAFAASLLMSTVLFPSSIFAAPRAEHMLVGSTAIEATNPNAAANITSVITSTTEDASGQTDQFKVGTILYVIIGLAGNPGYVKLDFYKNGELVELVSDVGASLIHAISPGITEGFQPFKTAEPAGKYTVQISWCTKPNCSDAVLVRSVSFSTV